MLIVVMMSFIMLNVVAHFIELWKSVYNYKMVQLTRKREQIFSKVSSRILWVNLQVILINLDHFNNMANTDDNYETV
jgi:hypothetical protein